MANTRQKRTVVIRKGIPQLFGAVKVGESYNFSTTFGKFQEASLLLYKKGSAKIWKEIPIQKEYCQGDQIAMMIDGLDGQALEYQYLIDGTCCIDPYAKAVSGRGHFGDSEEQRLEAGMKGVICDSSFSTSSIPGVHIPFSEMILYKLHVRGFTNGKAANVKKKGTFSGLVEKIPYLKELGITSVELMPAYDFAEHSAGTEMVNYWGYTGGYYFAPKAAYCAGKNVIEEFQNFVDRFHEAGLEVLMEFYFHKGMNPLMIMEVLRHWSGFYHVDGFHLVGEDIPYDLIMQDALLKETKIIYEGVGEKKNPSLQGAYCYDFMRTIRCFLKGDSGQAAGFVWQNRQNGNHGGVINYLTTQDGFTLADLVSYQEHRNEANGENNQDGILENYNWNCGAEGETKKPVILELRKQQIHNAILFLMLSQGTPMLYAGDEFGNSQKGNNNAWCQDNAIGWLDWSKNKRNEELLAFVKAAISFRKAYPILHKEEPLRETDYLACGFPEVSYHSKKAWLHELDDYSRSVGILYGGAYGNGEHLYIAYNMHWQPYKFALPSLPEDKSWYCVYDKEFYEEPIQLEIEKELLTDPRSIVIIIGR